MKVHVWVSSPRANSSIHKLVVTGGKTKLVRLDDNIIVPKREVFGRIDGLPLPITVDVNFEGGVEHAYGSVVSRQTIRKVKGEDEIVIHNLMDGCMEILQNVKVHIEHHKV